MEKSLDRKYNEDSRNKGVCGGRAASGAAEWSLFPGCAAQGCPVPRPISAGACAHEARPLSASGLPAPGERSEAHSAPRASAPLRGRAPTPRRSPGPPPAGWAAQRGLGAARTPAPEQRNAGRGRGGARATARRVQRLPRGASWAEVPACHRQERARSLGRERGEQGRLMEGGAAKPPPPAGLGLPPQPAKWVGGPSATAASWKTAEIGVMIYPKCQYLQCVHPCNSIM